MTLLYSAHHYFVTSDCVRLHYLDQGKGQVLLLLSSWTLSSEQYLAQVMRLSKKYRVIALDMRGHGGSEKVDYGYRVYRFAQDVKELLVYLSLECVTALGHSVGGSVLLAYWELFNGKRLNKLVLVDRPAMTISNPVWSQSEVAAFGAGMDEQTAMEVYHLIAGEGAVQYKTVLLNCMLSHPISLYQRQKLMADSESVAKKQAAALFYDDVHQDWRSVLAKISIPTLIIASEASPVSLSSQKWMQAQIPLAKIVIFKEHEGGKHFPFIENPIKFNYIVDNFMQDNAMDNEA